MKDQEFTAEEVYGSFQDPNKCRELIEMLLNSGLLPEIMEECTEYIRMNRYRNRQEYDG